MQMNNEKKLPNNDWGMKPLPSNGLTMMDLFCGAGIGATGFKRAGYEIVYAVDNQAFAVDTYNLNVGNHACVGDVRSLDAECLPHADIIVGGFPCKSYSSIGSGKGEDDEKNGDLAGHFVRLVKENKPDAFLFENVGGLVSKKHKVVFDRILSEFEKMGYRLSWKYLDCSDFGVPQKRKRVFAVGFRQELGITFKFPEPSGQTTTIREAIGDLPEPNETIDGLKNHSGFGIRKDEAQFVDRIPPGGNWRDLEVEDQKRFLGTAYYSGGGRTGFLRKVSFEQPAWTLTSMMNGKNNAQIVDLSDKYKGERRGNRRFTVRECLRLQTVPDSFYFPESISLRRQYERTSGIPSLVAYELGVAISEQLERARLKDA